MHHLATLFSKLRWFQKPPESTVYRPCVYNCLCISRMSFQIALECTISLAATQKQPVQQPEDTA